MRFAIVAGIILAFRAADLFTTWLASPDLAREVNPLYRTLGWRKAILFNSLCALFAADHTATVIVCVLSIMCSVWNICVWYRIHHPDQDAWHLSGKGTVCPGCQKPYEQCQAVIWKDRSWWLCQTCNQKSTQL